MSLEIDEIIKIFDIPIKKKSDGIDKSEEESDDDVYDSLSSTKDTFDDLSNELQKATKDSNIDIVKLQEEKTSDVNNDNVVDIKQTDVLQSSNKIENIDDIHVQKPCEVQYEEQINGEDVKIELGKWNLQSPAPKYDKFYKEKSSTLNYILFSQGGELPIDQFQKELIASKIDVFMPIYDCPEIQRKIQNGQQVRDRVVEIQMICSKQYFLWRTAVEMLQGYLMRSEQIKPAAALPGFVYEHMADMQFYFAQIEHIYKSSEKVVDNINRALDCLSRQITIANMVKPVEGYESKVTESIVKKSTPDHLKDFDSLIEKGDSKKPEISHKQAGWGDLATKRRS